MCFVAEPVRRLAAGSSFAFVVESISGVVDWKSPLSGLGGVVVIETLFEPVESLAAVLLIP